ncbi:hypothetical protein ISN44_As08g022450 [Arabidopsis suecica]|uniref:Uncharacterized protein n=1 Tax=Arabidopsis suecica TaxID=45249 RepID=A0A8T2B5Y6_ARASU|nr:hypothetical protein ISN44_As08g022450 [Arabidopsis suecica]
MGNCLRHESEMHWAGEDWDEFITEDEEDHHYSSKTTRDGKIVVVTRDNKSPVPSHEIKIRLTKKQLHDLLSKVNVHDLTFHQQAAFSCPSLNNRGYEEANQQRLWTPVLQSIPEVN